MIGVGEVSGLIFIQINNGAIHDPWACSGFATSVLVGMVSVECYALRTNELVGIFVPFIQGLIHVQKEKLHIFTYMDGHLEN